MGFLGCTVVMRAATSESPITLFYLELSELAPMLRWEEWALITYLLRSIEIENLSYDSPVCHFGHVEQPSAGRLDGKSWIRKWVLLSRNLPGHIENERAQKRGPGVFGAPGEIRTPNHLVTNYAVLSAAMHHSADDCGKFAYRIFPLFDATGPRVHE